MPKGKGTYGSQVGRPSKKNKYQVGGMIDPFSQKNPEGLLVQEALETKAALGEGGLPIEAEEGEFPTSNAMDRSESYQLGGQIQPPTAPSIAPTPQYKKGGKVKPYSIAEKTPKSPDITDIVKEIYRAEGDIKTSRNRVKKPMGASADRIEAVKESKKKKTKKMKKKILKRK